MIRRLPCALLGAVLLLLPFSPAAAQTAAPPIDPSFRADIERLMEITGASSLATQLANTVSSALIEGIRQRQPDVPDRLVTIVKEVLSDEFAKGFTSSDMRNKQVALYARNFTQAEIGGLLDFYASPVGKKAISVLPTLVKEGSALGEEWAQANTPRILGVLQARLKAEGLIP